MELKNRDYWNNEISNIYEGVTFKFKKLSPITHLSLVTRNTSIDSSPSEVLDNFIKQCLLNVLWTKDGNKWLPLVDDAGNSRLPEADEHPEILFDLFNSFRTEVLLPVFTESKTFQNFIKDSNENR